MPLVPEGAKPRQDVRASIAGQFWGLETASAASIDGRATLLPCEPVALGPTASTGLSRTQQLIASQALGVPAFPSYSQRDGGVVGRSNGGSLEFCHFIWNTCNAMQWGGGRSRRMYAGQRSEMAAVLLWPMTATDLLDFIGLIIHHKSAQVLDRVLAKVGGRTWWAALGGRLRAQKAVSEGWGRQGAERLQPLRDPDSYALCLRLHWRLARLLTLRALVEARDVRPVLGAARVRAAQTQRRLRRLVERARGKAGAQGDASDATLASHALDLEPAWDEARPPPASASYSAHVALPGSHELQARLAVTSEGRDAMGAATTVPLAASLDFCSAPERRDGMQYRLGFHQTLAPATGDGRGPLKASTHVQGAIAVEGETLLWRPGR